VEALVTTRQVALRVAIIGASQHTHQAAQDLREAIVFRQVVADQEVVRTYRQVVQAVVSAARLLIQAVQNRANRSEKTKEQLKGAGLAAT
jgi:hypothetical protein